MQAQLETCMWQEMSESCLAWGTHRSNPKEQREDEAHPERVWQHNHEKHWGDRRRVFAVRAQ